MLRTARVGRLGLLDDRDRPRVQPVTFVLHEGAIYTAVDAKPKRAGEPARVRFLRRRPEVAFTVDHYEDDWTRLAWVQVLGEIEVLDAADAQSAIDALVAKYEPYRAERPCASVFRLVPERILHWRADSG